MRIVIPAEDTKGLNVRVSRDFGRSKFCGDQFK